MMTMDRDQDRGVWIGRRVSNLRRARGMSQQALADALGVTQPRISAIERGKKPVTNRGRLLDIADALGVPNQELLGLPMPARTRDDLLTLSTVADIRAALDYPDEPVTPRPLRELAGVANTVLLARMETDYAMVGAGLPPLLAEARAAHTARPTATTGGVLVRALVAAALTLKPIGWWDLAMRCAQMAREVAAGIGDPAAYGAAEFAASQCVLANGNRRRSHTIATTAAAALAAERPSATAAARRRANDVRSWIGMLHLQAGFSAASLGDNDTSDEHMEVAASLAARVTGNPWYMEFGGPNVDTWGVGAALEGCRYGRAVDVAARADRGGLISNQRVSRLDTDHGRAEYLAGHPEEAVRAFLRAVKVAPREVPTRPAVVEIIGQMYRDATPRPSSDLRRLAKIAGVAA